MFLGGWVYPADYWKLYNRLPIFLNIDDWNPYCEGTLAFEVLQDKENPLLNRREVVCLFPDSAGKITRADVVKILSQNFNIPPERIIPISIRHSHGVRNTEVTVYIFKNYEDAKRQLPKHILQRLLPREERKKLAEQKRKPKEEK